MRIVAWLLLLLVGVVLSWHCRWVIKQMLHSCLNAWAHVVIVVDGMEYLESLMLLRCLAAIGLSL